MAELTVVIPVYNEELRIAKTCDAMLDFVSENPFCKVLFVNDGSVDNTVGIIEEKLRSNTASEHFRILDLKQNAGKGKAVKAGIENCNTEYVCFMDGDLAYSPEHLKTVFEKLHNSELVIGSRALGNDNPKNIPLIRRIFGWSFNKIVRTLLFMPYRDTQAGLKGFRTDAARQIFKRQLLFDFSFDVEILFLARKLKYHVAEIPAYVEPDHSEKASKVNLIKDSTKMFFSIFLIHINNITGKYA